MNSPARIYGEAGMKTKFFGVAAILAFLAVMSPASAAVNLITNGSFESGSFSAAPFDTLSAGDPSITGWTIGGDSIDWIVRTGCRDRRPGTAVSI